MIKTNHDIIGEQCIRNDDVVLEVIAEVKKSSIEKLSWQAFENKPCMG